MKKNIGVGDLVILDNETAFGEIDTDHGIVTFVSNNIFDEYSDAVCEILWCKANTTHTHLLSCLKRIN